MSTSLSNRKPSSHLPFHLSKPALLWEKRVGKNTSIPGQQPSSTFQPFILLKLSGGKALLNVFKTKFQVSRTLHSHKNVHEHRLVHVQAHTHRKTRTCSHRTLCECRHTHGQRLRETAYLPDFILVSSEISREALLQLC